MLLEDPRNALLAYDAMLLALDAAASNPAFMRVVDSIIDSISDASMRQANRLVDVDGESVNAAIEYLRSRMLSN